MSPLSNLQGLLTHPAFAWTWAGLGAMLLCPLGYLAALALSSKVRPPLGLVPGARKPRFCIVVPAHDEAAQIGQTVRSLRQVDYLPELFEVVVIADNCTDDTEGLARAAGAEVWPRQHATERGKGYALEFAFERVLAAGLADAVVVVDADTTVSRQLLIAMAAALQRGAQAVQGDYGVRSPKDSWRTLLMAVALGMFHRLRSLGRQSWRVSCGLRGNGMCFATALLRKHPHRAHGLVEDVEYGIDLGHADIAVAYADAAQVYGEMVASAKASQTQRQRWEGGRRQLVRQQLGPLAAAAWRRKSRILADLAADLAVPPLSTLGLMCGLGALGSAAAVAGYALGGSGLGAAPWPAATAWAVGLWATNCACLALYVVRGAYLSGTGWRGAQALCFAPAYIIWKLALRLKPGPKADQWVRTERGGQ